MSDPAHRVEETRAIEAVLLAEREAERAVAEAEERAERLLADTREHARRIGDRADARIRALHARADAGAEQAIRELALLFEDRERESRRTLANEALLDKAVRRVADWLLAEEAES
jgi:vacuolar-type H+-ATPase subunit H